MLRSTGPVWFGAVRVGGAACCVCRPRLPKLPPRRASAKSTETRTIAAKAADSRAIKRKRPRCAMATVPPVARSRYCKAGRYLNGPTSRRFKGRQRGPVRRVGYGNIPPSLQGGGMLGGTSFAHLATGMFNNYSRAACQRSRGISHVSHMAARWNEPIRAPHDRSLDQDTISSVARFAVLGQSNATMKIV